MRVQLSLRYATAMIDPHNKVYYAGPTVSSPELQEHYPLEFQMHCSRYVYPFIHQLIKRNSSVLMFQTPLRWQEVTSQAPANQH